MKSIISSKYKRKRLEEVNKSAIDVALLVFFLRLRRGQLTTHRVYRCYWSFLGCSSDLVTMWGEGGDREAM